MQKNTKQAQSIWNGRSVFEIACNWFSFVVLAGEMVDLET